MMMTIVAMVKIDGLGISVAVQLGTSLPGAVARAMVPVDVRMASPTVRYRVYWVIFAWPVWPSLRSVSSRGMTTASS